MNGLIDRAKRRFYDPNSAVANKSWWERGDYSEQCLTFLACWSHLIDEMAVRFPLDLIIAGTPDSRNFRYVGRLTSPATGAKTSFTLQAELESTLVISSADFAPSGAAIVDASFVQTRLNERITSFQGIRPLDQVNNDVPGGVGSIYMDRAILRDGEKLEFEIVNPTLAIQEYDYEIKGWTL